jgi:enoyl-CoA hydratase/carnithine racemase
MPLNGPDVVLYDKRDHIAFITLNRTERMNALNGDVYGRLKELWQTIRDDDSVWVAIMTGAGDRAFSAGVDLHEMGRAGGSSNGDAGGANAESAGPVQTPGTTWDMMIGPTGYDCWKPIIAAVNGYALAGGFQLAQRCDLRIASERAMFGIPEPRRHVSSPWISDLVRIIGLGHVLELCLTAEHFTAQRAYEMGFVNRVVPHERLMDEAVALAEVICKNSPISVQAHKEAVYKTLLMEREEGMRLANEVFRKLSGAEDAREGVRAFIERREPQWTGR